MQTYDYVFARVYNAEWSVFANRVAPLILDFYAKSPVSRGNKSVLDLCCGTGQLAVYLLERGYRVTGIDLSESMLQHAQENARRFIEAGQARFIQGDASNFTLDEKCGLVVSTFDSLNHLEDETMFNTVFDMEMVKIALLETGWREVYFARVFDLTEPIAEPEREGRVFVIAHK